MLRHRPPVVASQLRRRLFPSPGTYLRPPAQHRPSHPIDRGRFCPIADIEKLLKDREVLLSHFDFPAEHWIHLRSTNAIESTFATVRLRTKKTKGAGSRAAGLAMAYKLLDAAQGRWRCVNAPHLVALVRAGATFVDGLKVEREDKRNAA